MLIKLFEICLIINAQKYIVFVIVHVNIRGEHPELHVK